MTTDTAFWNKIARKYARSPIRNVPAYERTLNRTRAYLHAEDRVVELGAGTGTTALHLAPHVGDYLATDVAVEMVAIGREKAARKDIPQLRFGVIAAEGTGIEPGSRDVVIGFNLFHLVADRQQAFAEVHDALRPGGFFISKTVCLKGQGRWIALLIPLLRLVGRAPWVGLMTGQELENEIAAAGFDIVEADDHNRHPTARFVVARKR